MNDDDDLPSYAKHALSHLDMDEAFRSRMRAAIAAGLESAPDGVVTEPGTKNPIYVPTNPAPVRFSPKSDDF